MKIKDFRSIIADESAKTKNPGEHAYSSDFVFKIKPWIRPLRVWLKCLIYSPVILFSKLHELLLGYFDPKILVLVMKLDKFLGDLTDGFGCKNTDMYWSNSSGLIQMFGLAISGLIFMIKYNVFGII